MVSYFRRPHNKNEKPPVLLAILFGLLAATIIDFLVNVNWKLYQNRVAAEKQTAFLQDEIAKLEEQTKVLKEDLGKIGSEEWLEKTARERLNLKKRGEEVVAVIIPESTKEESGREQEKTWWKRALEKIVKQISAALPHLTRD